MTHTERIALTASLVNLARLALFSLTEMETCHNDTKFQDHFYEAKSLLVALHQDSGRLFQDLSSDPQ